jgi:hypothetical protein
MTNPNNISEIAYSLEDILETPVSEDLVALLTKPERAKVCSIKYQWTQGSQTAHQELIDMLEIARSRRSKGYRFIPKVKEYLKIKQL